MPPMNTRRRNVKILFLGQCLQTGYEGVPSSATYPALAHLALATRFPELNFIFDLRVLTHAKGLKSLLRYRLAAFKPDIAVINAIATMAATHWRSSLLYEIAPEIMVTARSFLEKLDREIGRGATFGKLLERTKGLRPQVLHPPLQLDEYERLLEDGINQCRTNSCRAVLMGPGGFNEDTKKKFKLQSPKLFASVNQMVLGLGKRLDVPVINAQEALYEYSGEVFLRDEHRFSVFGQEVVAREVEAVLTAQVAALLHNDADDLSEN
jgi:hypothetical protein